MISILILSVNHVASINGYVLAITVSLFLVRETKIFFLDKQYSIYSFVFIGSVLFNSIAKKLIHTSFILMSQEFCELYVYFLLLIDTLGKGKL